MAPKKGSFKHTSKAVADVFMATVTRITPNTEQVKARVGVLTALEQLVLGTFNGQAQIALVGSSAAGTELVSSDLDVTVTMPTTDQLLILRALLQQLQWATTGGWQQFNPAVSQVFRGARLEAVEAARIPIIKVTTSDGTLLDISFNQPLAIGSAQLVHSHISTQPFLAPLCRLVKYWVERRELPSPRHGGLGSYAWVLLVIFATQLDAKEKTNYFSPARSLQQMLLSFFQTLARFDYSSVISVRCACAIAKEYRWHRPGQLPVIEDPADASNNVAANISEATWLFLRAHFQESAQALAAPGPPQRAHDALFSNGFTAHPAIGLHPGQRAVYKRHAGLELGRVVSVAPKQGWQGDFLSRWDSRSAVVVEPYEEEPHANTPEPGRARVYAPSRSGEAPGQVQLVPSQVVFILPAAPPAPRALHENTPAPEPPTSSDDAGQGEQNPPASSSASSDGRVDGRVEPRAASVAVSGRSLGLLCQCEMVLQEESSRPEAVPPPLPAPLPSAPGRPVEAAAAAAGPMVLPEPRPRASGKRGQAMLIETPHSKKRRVQPEADEGAAEASPTPFAASPPLAEAAPADPDATPGEGPNAGSNRSHGPTHADEPDAAGPRPPMQTPSGTPAVPSSRSGEGMELTPCVNTAAEPPPAQPARAAWGGQRPLRLPVPEKAPAKSEGPRPLPVNAPKPQGHTKPLPQGNFGKGGGRKGGAAAGAKPPAPRPKAGGRGNRAA